MTEQRKPFRVEITINAARDEVWRTMTDPEQIRQWFGWDYAEIDGEIKYIFVDHVTLDAPGLLSFGDGSRIELVDDGPRTVVRAVLPGALDDGTDWDDVYDAIEEGWRVFFEQLRFLLETRPRGRRRTIYLAGTTSAAEALAIAGGGRAWHASRYQRMMVDPAGHLVAVGGQAPLDSDRTGPVAVTVTTYGLDDAAFAAVRDEWTRRWSAVADATVTTETGEAPVTAAR